MKSLRVGALVNPSRLVPENRIRQAPMWVGLCPSPDTRIKHTIWVMYVCVWLSQCMLANLNGFVLFSDRFCSVPNALRSSTYNFMLFKSPFRLFFCFLKAHSIVLHKFTNRVGKNVLNILI